MDNGEMRPLEGEDVEELEATDLGINEEESEVKEEDAENGND